MIIVMLPVCSLFIWGHLQLNVEWVVLLRCSYDLCDSLLDVQSWLGLGFEAYLLMCYRQPVRFLYTTTRDVLVAFLFNPARFLSQSYYTANLWSPNWRDAIIHVQFFRCFLEKLFLWGLWSISTKCGTFLIIYNLKVGVFIVGSAENV